MKGEAVPLAERERVYREAEAAAETAAAAYLDARAGGRLTRAAIKQMDDAQAELRRAKRRFEETARREAKRTRAAVRDVDHPDDE